ncbi:Swarming motility protein SwrC [Anaerolineae bacterium]|nr:Swarming motility protein SwrC [Anaerolineae bacterium]
MILRNFFAAVTRLSLRFKWVTIALTVLFLVLGVVAALQLNQELLPNIEFPQTFIVTLRPGASSEDLRDLVTIPLEDALATIPNVIPAGLESTTVSPVAFITVRNDYVPNQETIRTAIQTAIDKVVADGVPLGLKTTDDLNAEIVTKVLQKAPSMFKHFKAEHLRAMKPEVLDAMLAVNPEFAKSIDFLTLDALAADRINARLMGGASALPAVELPDAWRLGEADAQGNLRGVPRIITFNLSAIPVVTASISSTSRSAEELRKLVQSQLSEAVSKVEGVANVNVTGGEIIPPEVASAALKAIEEARAANAENGGSTTTPDSETKPGTPGNAEGGSGGLGGTNPAQTESAPALPRLWRQVGVPPLLLSNPLPAQLKERFETTVKFDTADDLLSATDGKGEKLTAAALLNQIAEINPASFELLQLPEEVINYVRAKETGFTDALSEAALKLVGSSVLSTGAWSPLLQQESIKALGITTFADFAKSDQLSSVAKIINAASADRPADLKLYAVRLVDDLLPESVAYILKIEPEFLSTIQPEVWRSFSAQTLSYLSAKFPDDLKDELSAIAEGKQPSLAESLTPSNGDAAAVVDDPNAPAMPQSWVTALGSFGFRVETANDLFKPPFGDAAGFFNQAAANPGAGNLFKDIPADLLIYLSNRDPQFFDKLASGTLSMFSEETLKALPASVQARVSNGPAFVAENNVTRANGNPSLILSVSKADGANTVQVFHKVDEVFKALMKDNPDISITPIFEQASFIEESISGVAREGGLGGVMAVVVILIFLHFSVRSTLVTAVSIPASLAIAFVMMRWVPGPVHQFLTQPSTVSALPEWLHTFLLRLFPDGITLNIMTLSGLTVAIGRVVDDSIVVLENIYRQLQKGMDRREAVIKGTRDVSVAIFAATLTTIVVFLPIGLTGGIVGEFFLPFGLAVTYSLAASFIVAITVIPVLAFLFIPPDKLPEEKEGRLEVAYHNVIEWALSHRAVVLGIAGVTFVIGMAIFAGRPTTFLPALGEPQISLSIAMPAGTPIAHTDALAREMEAFIEAKKGSGDEIKRYQTTIGSGGGFGDLAALIGGGATVNGANGQITIAIEAKGEALDVLTREIRAEAEKVFGVENVTVSRASISEQGFGGFEVVASGPEADLKTINATIKTTLSGVPGLANVSSTLDLVGETSSYLRVDRKAAAKYTAELEVTDTLGVTRKAITAVKGITNLPPSITVGEGFQSQQQTQGFAQTFSAIGVSVIAVYVVMVITFGSLVHPFTILFTLPLAVVGAAVALWVTNRVVGISALVGLLMLVGIVVTNAIVMIDRVQQNRKEKGMETREALSEGARTRLRPILMTAIATMIALLPLAIGLSEGAIIAAELGTVVIGGLFSSTVLTLFVIPVVYSLIEGSQSRLFGGRKTAK